MEENINLQNIYNYVQKAYIHNFEGLKEKCKKFMGENRKNLDGAQLKTMSVDILADALTF